MKRLVLAVLVLAFLVGVHSEAYGWGRTVGGGSTGKGGIAGENSYLEWVQVDVPLADMTGLTLGNISITVGQDGAPKNDVVFTSLTLLPLSSYTPNLNNLYQMTVNGASFGDVFFTWTVDPGSNPAYGHALLNFTGNPDISIPDPYYPPLNIGYRDWIEINFPFTITANGQSPFLNNELVHIDAPVPLPSALFLLGPGLAGLALVRRRLKK